MKKMRIGSGAGYSGDRIEPAIELAEKGNLDYLVFECLAERTIAIAQQLKMKDPEKGYDPLLAERVEAVLPVCREKRVKIITNMGAANIGALNFVMHNALGGGVTCTLAMDIHGKSLSSAILEMDIPDK